MREKSTHALCVYTAAAAAAQVVWCCMVHGVWHLGELYTHVRFCWSILNRKIEKYLRERNTPRHRATIDHLSAMGLYGAQLCADKRVKNQKVKNYTRRRRTCCKLSMDGCMCAWDIRMRRKEEKINKNKGKKKKK